MNKIVFKKLWPKNLLILLFLQPDGLNTRNFKLRLFDLTEFKFKIQRYVYDIELQRYMYGLVPLYKLITVLKNLNFQKFWHYMLKYYLSRYC